MTVAFTDAAIGGNLVRHCCCVIRGVHYCQRRAHTCKPKHAGWRHERDGAGGGLVDHSRPYLQSTPALRALEGVMEDCIETGIGMRVSRKAKLYMMKRLVVGGKVRSAAGLLGRAAEYGCCDFESRAP